MTNPTAPRDTLDEQLSSIIDDYLERRVDIELLLVNPDVRIKAYTEMYKELYKKINAYITKKVEEARIDQMNYVDQRLIGKNTGGERVFYDKEAVIAENHLKDQQRIISDAMKAEIKLRKAK